MGQLQTHPKTKKGRYANADNGGTLTVCCETVARQQFQNSKNDSPTDTSDQMSSAQSLTRANCGPGSLHDRIVKQWGNIRSYVIKDGHLYLALMADGGIYEFEPMSASQ